MKQLKNPAKNSSAIENFSFMLVETMSQQYDEMIPWKKLSRTTIKCLRNISCFMRNLVVESRKKHIKGAVINRNPLQLSSAHHLCSNFNGIFIVHSGYLS